MEVEGDGGEEEMVEEAVLAREEVVAGGGIWRTRLRKWTNWAIVGGVWSWMSNLTTCVGYDKRAVVYGLLGASGGSPR